MDDTFDLKDVMGADSLAPQDLVRAVADQLRDARTDDSYNLPNALRRWELMLRCAQGQL
jgi:hypothetical protein